MADEVRIVDEWETGDPSNAADHERWRLIGTGAGFYLEHAFGSAPYCSTACSWPHEVGRLRTEMNGLAARVAELVIGRGIGRET